MPSTLMVTLLYMIIELVRQVAVLAFPWLVVISPQSIRNLQECTSQVVAANLPTTEQSQYYPFFSSILEKAVYNRIVNYLNDNDILFQGQFGFRKNHSISYALIHLYDKISSVSIYHK